MLKDKLPGYVIVEKGGEKIGIAPVVAADNEGASSPGDKVDFNAEIGILKSAILEIESYGVNKIVALTHVGLEMDKQIAAAVSGIDASSAAIATRCLPMATTARQPLPRLGRKSGRHQGADRSGRFVFEISRRGQRQLQR
ncbi:MAG: hypothetical protein M9908_06620 [Phyllobacteriaceae bacterium]|nr:hypothetical protein [Phyllobacteriaceae bacterium]